MIGQNKYWTRRIKKRKGGKHVPTPVFPVNTVVNMNLHFLTLEVGGLPWPSGSTGWSVIPYTKRSQVRFPVGAHIGGNQSKFLSLSFSAPLPLPFSLESLDMSLGEDLKKQKREG